MIRTMHVAIGAAFLVSAIGCQKAPAPTAAAVPASVTEARNSAAEAALPRLTVDQVMTRVESHDPTVVYDNNSHDRYLQGHVPGAHWVAASNVTATDLPQNMATPVVFYCGGEQCSACHTAALQAIQLGHTQVSIMPAGISGWVAAGKPVTTGDNA